MTRAGLQAAADMRAGTAGATRVYALAGTGARQSGQSRPSTTAIPLSSLSQRRAFFTPVFIANPMSITATMDK